MGEQIVLILTTLLIKFDKIWKIVFLQNYVVVSVFNNLG